MPWQVYACVKPASEPALVDEAVADVLSSECFGLMRPTSVTSTLSEEGTQKAIVGLLRSLTRSYGESLPSEYKVNPTTKAYTDEQLWEFAQKEFDL